MPSVGKRVERLEMTHTADVNWYHCFGKLFDILCNSKRQQTTRRRKCPSTAGWRHNLWFINTVEGYITTKGEKTNKLLLRATNPNLKI